MQITIPDFSLVLLVGAAGAGKSTFAAQHFAASEVLSSDHYRNVVGDADRSDQTTKDAFAVMRTIAATRLARRRLTVIDATNLHPDDRKLFVEIARSRHAPVAAVVLDMPESTCQAQNALRGDDMRPPHVVSRHHRALRRSLRTLSREGFTRRARFRTPEEAAAALVVREPLACDRRGLAGPFDVIGDVHGCRRELEDLLTKLGYAVDGDDGDVRVEAPHGRTAVFTGDLVDRGPDAVGTLALVMSMVRTGAALAVQGNHDAKLAKALAGRDVERAHGLAETMAQLEARPEAFRDEVASFIRAMPTHCVLDRGRLVVAHAGMREDLQGRMSREVREFGLYGEITGETGADGLPVRTSDWTKTYRGRAAVIYGHTAVGDAEWINNTLCIDTGCVYGGRLTALRYPERELVAVAARQTCCEPPAAMKVVDPAAPGPAARQDRDDVLDIADLHGRLRLHTRLMGSVRIPGPNVVAALDVMSRFAVDPRWLIYLPPTMAPCEATRTGALLEHPAEAFKHFRARGVARVTCQEKHMGSRAVVVVARDADAAERRFGLPGQNGGIVHTRTGRRFFDDRGTESAVLDRFRAGLAAAGLWDELRTDWACIDCEIMPWSAKGAELVERQYAPAATAAEMGLTAAVQALRTAAERDPAHAALLQEMEERRAMTRAYDTAYRRYNWPVDSVDDLKIAPFHLLATEGAVHADKDHGWHLDRLHRIAGRDGILAATDHRTVDLDSEDDVRRATEWWEERTAAGVEGMVVKPWSFVARGPRGLVSPALKCRGREYLRIIYGPEYTADRNLQRLRNRSTGGKTARALREFALGIHGLEQFVSRAPLRDTHRAVLGVLALETEPADPRL